MTTPATPKRSLTGPVVDHLTSRELNVEIDRDPANTAMRSLFGRVVDYLNTLVTSGRVVLTDYDYRMVISLPVARADNGDVSVEAWVAFVHDLLVQGGRFDSVGYRLHQADDYSPMLQPQIKLGNVSDYGMERAIVTVTVEPPLPLVHLLQYMTDQIENHEVIRVTTIIDRMRAYYDGVYKAGDWDSGPMHRALTELNRIKND